MTKRPLILALWVIAMAALAFFLGFKMIQNDGPITASVVEHGKDHGSENGPEITIGGPFELVSHEGKTITDADFKGRYMLFFFGYSFCPDICPFELTTMSQALDILEDEGLDITPIQPLFISVDPERDTVDALSAYMPAFHEAFIGLTGSREQVDAMLRAYNIYASKAELEDSTDYLMNHSSLIYFMGKDGEFLRYFPPKKSPEEMAAGLRAYLQ